MKIKTILFSGILGFAFLITAQAQPVYSVNAVGYYTLTLPPGYTMIANQLTNVSTTVSALFSNVTLPAGTTVVKWTGTGFLPNEFNGGWDFPNQTVGGGEGVFLLNPTGSNLVITIAGDVPQGTLTTSIPSGFSMQSSRVPQAGRLQSDLGYVPASGESVLRWSGTGYIPHDYDGVSWDPVEPNLKVGESFFIFKPASGSWVRTFNVN